MKLVTKSVKINTTLSEETLCFSASIYADGKRAGIVGNHGHGGPNFYHWDNRELGKAVEQWADQQDTEFDFEKLDQIIDKIVIDTDEQRRCKRLSKTKTLFRIEGDSDEYWRELNHAYSPAVQDWLDKKYGTKVTDIFGVK